MSRPLRVAMLMMMAMMVMAAAVSAAGAAIGADSDAETDASMALDQSVLDSAAKEIRAMLEAQDFANGQQTQGQDALISGSSVARAFEAAVERDQAAKGQRTVEADAAFAFLSSTEEPVPVAAAAAAAGSHAADPHLHLDVEASLDTIAAELDSLFQTDAEKAAVAQAKVQAEAAKIAATKAAAAAHNNLKMSRAQKGRARAKAARAAKAAPAPAASPVAKPSRRQQKLISRLDGYRASRGHAGAAPASASMLESGTQSRSSASARAQVQSGYSAPSAYMAPQVAVAPMAFQGQVGVNQAAVAQSQDAALYASLGFAPPAPPAVQVLPAAAPAAANVGLLIQALKRVQEEQQTTALVSKLSALLGGASGAPAVGAPQQQIPSPFNYGQTLQATPAGWANPNLAPSTFGPRVLPGAIPGMAPSYPSYIPSQQARVGVADEQNNPFANHMP